MNVFKLNAFNTIPDHGERCPVAGRYAGELLPFRQRNVYCLTARSLVDRAVRECSHVRPIPPTEALAPPMTTSGDLGAHPARRGHRGILGRVGPLRWPPVPATRGPRHEGPDRADAVLPAVVRARTDHPLRRRPPRTVLTEAAVRLAEETGTTLFRRWFTAPGGPPDIAFTEVTWRPRAWIVRCRTC